MWQRRGGSADQLVGLRSTCPVRASSPLTAVCQPEKEGLKEEGREEGQENNIKMWQPQIEIEHCSIGYFDCITVFKVPYSAELLLKPELVQAIHRLILGIHACTLHKSPTLNRSSVLHFEHGYMVETCNEIMLNFYLVLLQTLY